MRTIGGSRVTRRVNLDLPFTTIPQKKIFFLSFYITKRKIGGNRKNPGMIDKARPSETDGDDTLVVLFDLHVTE